MSNLVYLCLLTLSLCGNYNPHGRASSYMQVDLRHEWGKERIVSCTEEAVFTTSDHPAPLYSKELITPSRDNITSSILSKGSSIFCSWAAITYKGVDGGKKAGKTEEYQTRMSGHKRWYCAYVRSGANTLDTQGKKHQLHGRQTNSHQG